MYSTLSQFRRLSRDVKGGAMKRLLSRTSDKRGVGGGGGAATKREKLNL